MSWNMANSDTLIKGYLKELFKEGIRQCYEYIEQGMGADWYTEPGYYTMPREQKLAALCYVWKGLTEENFPGKAKAWSEATIYTVFQAILTEIEIEIDNGYGHTSWRDKLNKAWLEYDGENQAIVYVSSSELLGKATNTEEADSEADSDDDDSDYTISDKIEILADIILWDRDWQGLPPLDLGELDDLGILEYYNEEGCSVKGLAEEFEAYLREWGKEEIDNNKG